MTEPDRILHLVNAAITAHRDGGQAALEEHLSQLNDTDLKALITTFADNLGAHARFHTPDQSRRGGQRQ